MSIDPRRDRPAYKQLADIFRARILSGALGPGAKLPGENRIVQEYGVTRDVVRRAMGVLRTEGLVVTSRGYGSWVRDVPDRTVVHLAAGDRATARMPFDAERHAYDAGDGTPLFVVSRGDTTTTEVYLADRTELAGPAR